MIERTTTAEMFWAIILLVGVCGFIVVTESPPTKSCIPIEFEVECPKGL